MLATELTFVHAATPQTSPQESFRISGVLTELAGKLNEEGEAFAGDFITNLFQACEHVETHQKVRTSVKEAFCHPSPKRRYESAWSAPHPGPLLEGWLGGSEVWGGERAMRVRPLPKQVGATKHSSSPRRGYAWLNINLRGEAG
jgi:hypothetical protein